ncbi:MAG: methyltransferase domain-containing protein [Gammaproteobacteria bacterium]
MATAVAARGRILDYGCGQGEVVAAGVERGLDVYGAEVFFGGAHGQREAVARRGLLGRRVVVINQGETPFEDGSFDFVFANQVFEHVPDLDKALQEIRRVLKPGGKMLSLFPCRDVLREGHCGIPLAHRFKRGSKLRYIWLLTGRKLGFGTFHGDKSHEQWARDFAHWLEDWCYYRSRTEIIEAYRRWGFSFESYETEYAAFRLQYMGRVWAVPASAALSRLTQLAVRKLAGMVVLSRKEDGQRSS